MKNGRYSLARLWLTSAFEPRWTWRHRNSQPRQLKQGIPVEMSGILFGTTDWSSVDATEHKGESGFAYWRTRQFGSMRVRMIEYTPGYLADHWCTKGHILLCVEGELHTELEDGRVFTLKPGVSYQVGDGAEPHRSYTDVGAKLFVVD